MGQKKHKSVIFQIIILYNINHEYSIHVEELYGKKSMFQDQTLSFLKSVLLYSSSFDIKILEKNTTGEGKANGSSCAL